jgi:hypothetical protein
VNETYNKGHEKGLTWSASITIIIMNKNGDVTFIDAVELGLHRPVRSRDATNARLSRRTSFSLDNRKLARSFRGCIIPVGPCCEAGHNEAAAGLHHWANLFLWQRQIIGCFY